MYDAYQYYSNTINQYTNLRELRASIYIIYLVNLHNPGNSIARCWLMEMQSMLRE